MNRGEPPGEGGRGPQGRANSTGKAGNSRRFGGAEREPQFGRNGAVGGSQAAEAPGLWSCQDRWAWPREPQEAARTDAWKQRAQVYFRSLAHAVYRMDWHRQEPVGEPRQVPREEVASA